MFAYNPTVNDNSGAIVASGQMQAAQANAQMMQGIGDNIGKALMTIGSAYKDYSDMKSSIKSGEKMLDVLGPAIGMTTEKLKALGYNDMKDREKAMFFNNLFSGGNYAVAAQARNFGVSSGLRQRQMEVQQNMPINRAAAKAAGNAAAGQSTVRPLAMPGVDLNFVD